MKNKHPIENDIRLANVIEMIENIILIFAKLYVYMCTCVCMCMYVCVHVCVYVYKT